MKGEFKIGQFFDLIGRKKMIKKRARFLALNYALALFFIFPAFVHGGSWQKYVSRDQSFSFHYPEGWEINAKESNIEITNPRADEQLLIIALPFDKSKSPAELANYIIDALRKSMSPDFRAFNWQANDDTKGVAEVSELTFALEGKRYRGELLVLKDSNAGQAYWFSFTGPETGYSRSCALTVLQGLVSSVAKGSASKPPDILLPALNTIDRNSRAFLFVLEFAMGAPFTTDKERLILKELWQGWEKRTEEQIHKYDDYPRMVERIMSLGQKDLAVLRVELEKTIREWLKSMDQTDPVVSVITSQLNEKSKVLIPGDPPLTVRGATAYSEMYAYSELLQIIPNALPDQVSLAQMSEIKQQLMEAWQGFSQEERIQVASTPGLWISLRALLQYGTSDDQARVRGQIQRIAAHPAEAGVREERFSTSSGSTQVSRKRKVMDMASHMALMAIERQTFNHYLFCHGFRNTIGY
jgi:hypothetical protein